jgi:hypothetical protein
MNQTKSFNGGHGKGMRKAAKPSSDVDSSNPRRWRGWRLHHHAMVVVFVRKVMNFV